MQIIGVAGPFKKLNKKQVHKAMCNHDNKRRNVNFCYSHTDSKLLTDSLCKCLGVSVTRNQDTDVILTCQLISQEKKKEIMVTLYLKGCA